MQHFPIFLAVAGRRIVVSGGADAALAKLRLLLKTKAHIHVFAQEPDLEIQEWASQGLVTLTTRALDLGDCICAALFYAANENALEDARVAKIAHSEGALVNIVDNLQDSAFITPAIVDRDPVVVAIGTEGAAPVLARKIKADLEEQLPSTLGRLARIGKSFRTAVNKLPMGRIRRDFWRDYYFKLGPQLSEQKDSDILQGLKQLLNRYTQEQSPTPKSDAGRVAFVGAGPGDPELLTLKARKALDTADVVLYDTLVPKEILELARREALLIHVGKTGFGPSTPQDKINRLIVEHAQNGSHVVRLKSGDPTIFGRLSDETQACTAASIAWSIVPGITAASAAAASIGVSLTQRGRNSELRFMTGHDVNGYAAQDWQKLAQGGAVAALYMGKKSAHYIQGRLLMHGAAPQTPVTCVENAGRSSQTVITSTLEHFVADLSAAQVTGPVITLYGLAHTAELNMQVINQKLAASEAVPQAAPKTASQPTAWQTFAPQTAPSFIAHSKGATDAPQHITAHYHAAPTHTL